MDFLIFGTLWFWIFLGVIWVAITLFLETAFDVEIQTAYDKDNGGGRNATIVLIIAIVVYYFLGSKEHLQSILQYITVNPFKIALYVLGYYAAGVVWSFVKWWSFLTDKHRFIVKYNKKDFTSDDIPKAKDNKNRIISWMTYWVFSLIWSVISRVFRKWFQYIYERIELFYDRMSKKIFAEFLEKEKAK